MIMDQIYKSAFSHKLKGSKREENNEVALCMCGEGRRNNCVDNYWQVMLSTIIVLSSHQVDSREPNNFSSH